MMKIVFIESGCGNTNNIKRMEEFVARGFEVAAYAFDRGEDNKNHPKGITVQSIGSFLSDSSYLSRVSIIKKGIRDVLNKHKKEDCLFYLFRNDIAQVYSLISKRPYIFEEADMTHLELGNILGKLMEWNVKRIIRHSVISTFRSEGFIKYHFGDKRPDNVFCIPNRLHPDVQYLSKVIKSEVNDGCIKFGFVGHIRYNSILSFVTTLLLFYPQHQFHFFGSFPSAYEENKFSVLTEFSNCFFHGPFRSPYDLPKIYGQIDVLLSTYDVDSINPQYAEPNKFYEAIYYDTPIIVSSNSYIADKVNTLGIGYYVNAFDQEAVRSLINQISGESIREKQMSIAKIDKQKCINNNDEFFKKLECRIGEFN